MKLVNGFAEFRTHVLIIFVAKLLGRVFAKVVAKEWVLKSEGVRYLKLLPSYHSASPNLVRLHFEAAVFVAKEVSFLGKNARQDSYDGPAEETSISRSIASIEKRIFFLWVAMYVAVNPDISLLCFCKIFEQLLYKVYFGLEVNVGGDPMSI